MAIIKKISAPNFALVIGVALMVACSWLAPLDSAANQQVNAGLKRALVSFATARALNAVISVAQGTEVAVEPVGIGVNFAPGQLLDPINDLVEQFGDLMLVASVAFGVQKVLLSIGANWAVSLLLTVSSGFWAYYYLRQKPVPAWLFRTLIVLLMARFAMPVVTIGSDLVFQKFLAADYQASQQVIDTASGQLNNLNTPARIASEDTGMIEKFKGWMSQNTDVKGSFEKLKQAAEQMTEHMIKLMVIFLLQTLVIPLLLLWALLSIAKGTFVPLENGSVTNPHGS